MTLLEVEERLRECLNISTAFGVTTYSVEDGNAKELVRLLRDIERARLLGLK